MVFVCATAQYLATSLTNLLLLSPLRFLHLPLTTYPLVVVYFRLFSSHLPPFVPFSRLSRAILRLCRVFRLTLFRLVAEEEREREKARENLIPPLRLLALFAYIFMPPPPFVLPLPASFSRPRFYHAPREPDDGTTPFPTVISPPLLRVNFQLQMDPSFFQATVTSLDPLISSRSEEKRKGGERFSRIALLSRD